MWDKLLQSLHDTDKLLEGFSDAHEKRLHGALLATEKKILTLLKRLKTGKNGEVLGPKWTLKQAQSIHAHLGDLLEEEFGSTVKAFFKDYDQVNQHIHKTLKGLGVPTAFRPIDKETVKLLKDQDWKFYKTLMDDTVEKDAQLIYNAVMSGTSYGDLTRQIAATINTYTDIRGVSLAVHAGTYAQDALMNFYQTIHNQKAEDEGLEHYLYFGNVIRDSRPFCVLRAGKVFDKKTIDGWNELDWKGKRPGNVWVNRGGYRCRHHFHAVDPDWIPEGEIPVQKWDPHRGKAIQSKKFKPAPIRDKPLTFDNIETIQEAEEWASGKWNWISWDFEGTHVDTVKPTLRKFDELAQEYPEVARRLKYVGTYKGDLPSEIKGKVPADIWKNGEFAHATRDGKYIGINPLFYGDPELYRGWLKTSVQTGFHPPGCDTFESILTHEFGHMVMNWLESLHGTAITPAVPASGQGLISEMILVFTRKKKPTDALSRYARVNRREAWAESWSALNHSPKKRWTGYTRDQKRFLAGLKKVKWYRKGEWKWLDEVQEEDKEKAVKLIQQLFREELRLPHLFD